MITGIVSIHRDPFLQRSIRRSTRRPHRNHSRRPIPDRLHRLQPRHQQKALRILNGEMLFVLEYVVCVSIALSNSRKRGGGGGKKKRNHCLLVNKHCLVPENRCLHIHKHCHITKYVQVSPIKR